MTYVTPKSVREGFENFSAFLDDNPDFPLGDAHAMTRMVHGTPQDQQAEINRIAAMLGTEPVRRGNHYHTERDFGGGVIYTAAGYFPAAPAIPAQRVSAEAGQKA